MKNKIIYLFILIFSASLFSAARKNKSDCGKAGVCTWLNKQSCNESKKPVSEKEFDFDLTPFGLFFFNA